MDATGDVGDEAQALRSEIAATSRSLEGRVRRLKGYARERRLDLRSPFKLRHRLASRPLLWSGVAFGVGLLVGSSRAVARSGVIKGVGRASGGILAGFGRSVGARLLDLAVKRVVERGGPSA
jgi:hypothetical protein